MKKLHTTATALLLTAALFLSGCDDKNTSSEISNVLSSDSADDPNNSISDTSENLTPDAESNSASEIDFPRDSFVAPDGSTIYLSEAARADQFGIEFDFAYIRYAKPVFLSTLDEPDLFDWEKDIYCFFQDYCDSYEYEDLNYFKARPGDKLDNGLVVSSAKYVVDKYGNPKESNISFDGELTLTGIMEYQELPEGRDLPKDYVLFFADCVQFDSFPIIYPCGTVDSMSGRISDLYEFAIVYDNTVIDLGSADDINIVLSDVIAPGEWKKVKITINNIHTRENSSAGRSLLADLISAELI